MFVHMHIYIYICFDIYIYTCIFVCISLHVYTYIYLFIYTFIDAFIYKFARLYNTALFARPTGIFLWAGIAKRPASIWGPTPRP